MSTSVSQPFVFPRPVSPAKDALKPNPHPYPIKTTSTALLSRSNSSPRHQAHHSTTSHNYVPSHPSPSPTSSAFRSPSHASHRYSRSLTSDSPRPLPVPPSPSSESVDQVPASPSPRRVKRTNTLPVQPPSPSPASSFSFGLEDLPSNPKTWTPSQLCVYLATALRVRSGESLELPERVAQDIANFVKESRINGRIFLRLTEAELEGYGINRLWRTALYNASRNLRHNVVKGQIWGFGNNIEDSPHSPYSGSPPPEPVKEENEEGTPQSRPNHRRRRSSSVSFANNPFVNGTAFYSGDSSSSVEDLSRSQESSPVRGSKPGGHYRSGKVKGMVDSWDARNSSIDEGRPSFIRERTTSSASTASSSSLPSDGEAIEEVYATTKQGQRPLPIPPSFIDNNPEQPAEEEHTVEELLAMQGDNGLPGSVAYALHKRDYDAKNDELSFVSTSKKKRKGVHAWEADSDDVGIITMKRVPAELGSDAPDSTNSSGGASAPIPIGAIFEEQLPEGLPDTRPAAAPVYNVHSSVGAEDVGADTTATAVQAEAQLIAEEAKLQDQVDATRALLEQFKSRLADVEGKIEEMEANEQEKRLRLEAEALEKEAATKNAEASQTATPGPVSPKMGVLDPKTLHGKLLSGVLGIPTNGEDADPQTAEEMRRKRLTAYDKLLNPKTITQLPSYVILVSLGMCAVIFKVLTRRALGGRR